MAVAHVGHAELRVTDLQASKKFFTDIVGLCATEETETAVYLRAWQDFDHHTLTLVKGEVSGPNHIAWRVENAQAMYDAERRFKELNIEHKWVAGGTEPGQGDGLRFFTPAGTPMELYWERELYQPADSAMISNLPSHPQKFLPRGIAPRRFDHVNVLLNDVAKEQEWLTGVLGIHHRYFIETAQGDRLGSWLSRTNVSHEIALMRNRNQTGTLLHHVAYYLDSMESLANAASILGDQGIKIEWGPGKHGTSGAQFLYFFEPSGNRVELWTNGFLIFAPDWEPLRWDGSSGHLGLDLWGTNPPESYLTYGTAMPKSL